MGNGTYSRLYFIQIGLFIGFFLFMLLFGKLYEKGLFCLCDSETREESKRVMRAGWISLYITFMQMLAMSLDLLSCKSEGDLGLVLVAEHSQICFTNIHLPAAIIAVWCLYQHTHNSVLFLVGYYRSVYIWMFLSPAYTRFMYTQHINLVRLWSSLLKSSCLACFCSDSTNCTRRIKSRTNKCKRRMAFFSLEYIRRFFSSFHLFCFQLVYYL